MGKSKHGQKPVTAAQIERMIESVKGAMEKVYEDLMTDYLLMKVLKYQDSSEAITRYNSAYAKQLVTLHANISDSLLCLCVLLLCNFRAEEPIEKRFILRRIVVVCHELYKYLYGFTKKETDWERIAQGLDEKYSEECEELSAQSDKYLKKYGQSEDKILRDVSNHYSDNPIEFFRYISTINEQGQADRALQMLSIAQPLNGLLMKELTSVLPSSGGRTAFHQKSGTGECQFKDVFAEELMQENRRHLKHRHEIVREHVQRLKRCETFAARYGYDITKDERWSLLKDDNIVLHILYLQLDTMVLSLAMGRAGSHLEEKMILAYMTASMHEGFKKLYGFTEKSQAKSLWQRYAVNKLEQITDTSLTKEIQMVTGVLNAFAEKDYLKNPAVTLFLSHVGYVKDLQGESSNAMAEYLLQEDFKDMLAGVVRVLSYLNVMADVSRKLLNYENQAMKEEKQAQLDTHLREIDEIEEKALQRMRNEKNRREFLAQTAEMKVMLRRLYRL